jgi:hypothetical protein
MFHVPLISSARAYQLAPHSIYFATPRTTCVHLNVYPPLPPRCSWRISRLKWGRGARVTSRGTPEPASLSGYVIGQYGTDGRVLFGAEDVDPACVGQGGRALALPIPRLHRIRTRRDAASVIGANR